MNRDHYGVTYARYWDGTTGRAIQEKGKDPTILSLYLMSCRHANMIGLYELPLVHLERELLVVRGRIPILRAFHDLHVLHYATYDLGTEHVWVREMARIRVGLDLQDTIKPNDKQHQAILRLYRNSKPNPFLTEFHARYHDQLRLEGPPRIGPPIVPVAKALEEMARRNTVRPQDRKNATQLLVTCGKLGPICGKPQAPYKGSFQNKHPFKGVRAGTGTGTGTESGAGTGTGSAAAKTPRHTPPNNEDADRNVEVITSLIRKELFPLLGATVHWTDLKEVLIERCRALGITYTYDVFHKAYESALFRADLKHAGGGTR